MGQLVALPQLVQDLILLPGGGAHLLLQSGHLPFHAKQLVIGSPGILVRLVALALQHQPFLVDDPQTVSQGLALPAQAYQPFLRLAHLLGQLLVLFLKLGNHGGTLGTVTR